MKHFIAICCSTESGECSEYQGLSYDEDLVSDKVFEQTELKTMI